MHRFSAAVRRVSGNNAAMKRALLLAVLLCSLSLTAGAQDFDKGLAAYNRGDYATALREWRPLAERGLAKAQYNLGAMYYYAEGVPQGYAEAAKWWRKAAEQGYASAQYGLGVSYEQGQGVPQDHAEAVKWYRKAAEQGDADALNNLGVMYDLGKGVPQDHAEAYIWYSLAAAGGHKKAPQWRDEMAAKLSPDQLRAAQREATRRWGRIQARKK